MYFQIKYTEATLSNFLLLIRVVHRFGWIGFGLVGCGRDFSVFGGLGWVHYSKSHDLKLAKVLIAVLRNKFIVLFIIIFGRHTFVPYTLPVCLESALTCNSFIVIFYLFGSGCALRLTFWVFIRILSALWFREFTDLCCVWCDRRTEEQTDG